MHGNSERVFYFVLRVVGSERQKKIDKPEEQRKRVNENVEGKYYHTTLTRLALTKCFKIQECCNNKYAH